MRRTIVMGGFLAVLLGAGLPYAAFAQDTTAKEQKTAKDIKNAKPSATVSIEAEQIRLIIGGSTGKGVLNYKGKQYPFTFKGATAGGVGVTKVAATGNVYFLNKAEDFAGKYSAVTAGAAVGKGTGASSFENDKGVYVSLRSKTEGVALNMGVGVATVVLVKK